MAAFIMSGPLQALAFIVLFAIVSFYLPLMGLLSNGALGLITLRMGWKRGLSMALIAALAVGIAGFVLHRNWSGFVTTLLEWLPVIALAALLANTASWPKVFYSILATGCLAVIAFHLSVDDPETVWLQAINSLTNIEQLEQQFNNVDIQSLLRGAAPYLTGFLASGLGIALVLSLMLARHWQAKLYNPGGFQAELKELRLNKKVGIALSAVILAAIFNPTPLLVGLIVVGLAVFLFQGVAVIHGSIALLNLPWQWLFGLYIPLLLLPLQMGLLLAVMGMVDSIADFRTYLSRRPQR